ncbi:TetR/AcrR family transcriptional regulator [[Mycobacterium] crassicus]|uniref:Helix-turn-helix domain-containing protein n=1 Tax=[Mycobacterium] crassicus TaxID=2872309 RepID=A0ABU5XKN3_9MYCO|nr:helix-turn-helix domain-containing protein [Mycolicibacter sp. MYC098]MEB3022840.1 helix-turn-helix domain-containing protein [Mycolicibacter sp. MYC098]
MATATQSPLDQQESIESRILDAALVQFANVGVKKTTIEDIARRAGVDRVTVYRRIGSRDDVVQAVTTREVATVLTELGDISARHDDIGDLISAIFVTVVTRWRAHPLVNRMLLLEPERVMTKLTVESAETLAMSIAATAAALQGAADRGLLPDMPDLTTRAELLCRVIHSLIVAPHGTLQLQTEAELDAFARGYLTPLVIG